MGRKKIEWHLAFPEFNAFLMSSWIPVAIRFHWVVSNFVDEVLGPTGPPHCAFIYIPFLMSSSWSLWPIVNRHYISTCRTSIGSLPL